MGASPPPAATPPGGDPPDDGDRPTLIPDFDPHDFARDSEVRQRAAVAAGGEPTIDQARRLHGVGDDEGALFLLTQLLELAPLHPLASKLAAECRAALEQKCISVVGSEATILVPAVSAEELKVFGLDTVSAFLFSRLDGVSTLEEVLDGSGQPRLLALRHLRNLFERGLVADASKGPREQPEPSVGNSGVLSARTSVPPPTGAARSTGIDRASPTFRVIAEGDDAVGTDLALAEAVAVLEFARERGMRHVAIVDDSTGAMVDEETARRSVERE